MRKKIGDLDINYEVEGSGPPLVLVHGGGADLICWEEMVPHLARDFTVYRYDQRGFGETQRPEKPVVSLDVWTQDLLHFLDAFSLESPALAGWSLGGSVILDFACEHPTRCSAAIPIGAPGPNKVVLDKSGFVKRQELADQGLSIEEIIDATFDFTKAAFSQWSRDENPESLEKIRAMLCRNSAGDYAEMVAAFDQLSDYGEKLPNLRARTLILCGDEDGRTPPNLSEAIHEKLPGSQLALVPNCGHYGCYEKPAETSALIRDFLKAS